MFSQKKYSTPNTKIYVVLMLSQLLGVIMMPFILIWIRSNFEDTSYIFDNVTFLDIFQVLVVFAVIGEIIYFGKAPIWISFDETGINTRGLFRAKKMIPWESFCDSGILNNNRTEYLYFSQYDLKYFAKYALTGFRPKSDILVLKCDDDILSLIRCYYHGEIKDLRNQYT